MNTSSFKLVGTISADDDASCVIPVRKYVSSKTGMRLYVCNIDGPVIEGYFSLATEATDDDGLPHTLEHMIFLGSEDYPYSGVLDIFANKLFAAGTNAWTAVDNTTYTISTVEKLGFLQVLPIYLDHIFYPLLNESGFVTEVYHVNGDGEDGGVVYSEMQSVENENDNVAERALHRALYPNLDCGYRYETGGMLENLRNSCSHKKVCDYHKKMYRPDNMAIIVAGQIEAEELIDVLEKFEKKILSKNPDGLKLDERPFTRPISLLNENIEQTVYFPCDKDSCTSGTVSIGWRGPHISDLKQIFSLDLLLYYLTDSSISPLYSHFISEKSYCSKIHYKVEEYRESFLNISFTNTQIEHLNKIKSELFVILHEIYEGKIEFDMNRMFNIIKMKISELKDKFEDSPHETISLICIGDFLYGTESSFKQTFIQTKLFESLKHEAKDYWLNLLKKFMIDSYSVLVIAKPCEKLMCSIGEEDKKRVEDRKKQLGKKGLKELKIKIEDSIAENDECELPDDIYDSLQIPSLENLKYKQLKQFFTYQECLEQHELIRNNFNNFSSLKHLQMQVDHLEATNFVQAFALIDTTHLSNDLRYYLELFTNVLFELPVKNSEIDLTHEQVVYDLNKDLLEFDVSLGINGSQFDPGSFSQYLSIFTKTQFNDYELAIKWLKLILFDTQIDKKQIQISVSNLLKEINKRKTEPLDLISNMCYELYFKQESNLYANGFMRQEKFLNQVLKDLNESDIVEKKLTQLKKELLNDKLIRFYVCADFNKLKESYNFSFDKVWLDYFPPNGVFKSNEPFKVDLTWNLKKNLSINHKTNSNVIYTPESKHDYLINLGSSESSYVHLISSCDIQSFDHPNYAGLLVLIEYFTQTEGPLYEAVRGPGYCYSQSIYVSPEKGLLELGLDRCAHVTKAYEAVRKLFIDHLNKKDKFDENLLESAKNTLIFLLIDDLKSVSNFASYSMSCHFKNVKLSAVQELIKKVEKVDLNELKTLLKSYLIPLFDDNFSNCLLVCHPAKSEQIQSEFSQKFDRKLNIISKVDDCLF